MSVVFGEYNRFHGYSLHGCTNNRRKVMLSVANAYYNANHMSIFFFKVTESGAGVRILCFAEYQNSVSISLDSIRLNSLCYGTLCLTLHLSVRFTGYEFIDMAWNTIPMWIQSICGCGYLWIEWPLAARMQAPVVQLRGTGADPGSKRGIVN